MKKKLNKTVEYKIIKTKQTEKLAKDCALTKEQVKEIYMHLSKVIHEHHWRDLEEDFGLKLKKGRRAEANEWTNKMFESVYLEIETCLIPEIVERRMSQIEHKELI